MLLCKGCKKWCELSMFNRAKTTRRGYSYRCKACCREYAQRAKPGTVAPRSKPAWCQQDSEADLARLRPRDTLCVQCGEVFSINAVFTVKTMYWCPACLASRVAEVVAARH